MKGLHSMTMAQKIEAYSEKIPEAGCWLWLLALDKDGYGHVKEGGKRKGAHRVSYAHFVGQIPEGIFVCHRCDTPTCVNPAHLFLGTVLENTQDRNMKGRQARGARHGRTTLNEDQVREIRSLYQKGVCRKVLQKRFNLSKTQTRDVGRGKKWVLPEDALAEYGRSAP